MSRARRTIRRPQYRGPHSAAADRAAGPPPSRSSRSASVGVSTAGTPAVREHHARHRAQPDHRADRALRLRQEHADPLLQPHERPDRRRRRSTARSCTTGRTSTGPASIPVEVRKLIGMVFQKPNPFPEVDLRQHRLRPARDRDEGRHGRDRRAGADAAPRCGTRSRTGSRRTRTGCPAASSSGCASRAASRSSPT